MSRRKRRSLDAASGKGLESAGVQGGEPLVRAVTLEILERVLSPFKPTPFKPSLEPMRDIHARMADFS